MPMYNEFKVNLYEKDIPVEEKIVKGFNYVTQVLENKKQTRK